MKIEHIAVATDFSEPSERAVQVGAKLAKATGARISLVHAYNPTPLGPGVAYPAQVWAGADLGMQLRTAAIRELDRTRAERLGELDRVDTAAIGHSSAALALSDFAEENSVDLIVVGTHGRSGVAHLLIGSVAANTIRHAPCPVLAVRPTVDVASFPRDIVVATDFSPNAEAGLAWAATLREQFGTKLTVVHVYVTPQTIGAERIDLAPFETVDKDLRRALEQLHRDRFGGREDVKTELLVASSASEALIQYAEQHDTDLLVLTTHGRTGLKRLFMGSVAEKVTRHAPCAVLAARMTPR